MNEISAVIDTLHSRIDLLIKKGSAQEKANRDLAEQLLQIRSIVSGQQLELDALKKENETLRMANSLLGSEDNRRDTKLKINSLIREIDHCISQLSD